jgi:hypothetical protein
MPYLPEGAEIHTQVIPVIPGRLIFALGRLFETLGYVSKAFIVQVQIIRPGENAESPHPAIEIELLTAQQSRFSTILPQIEDVVRLNYPYNPDKPVDIFQIGHNAVLKKFLANSQLIYMSTEGKSIPL